MLEITIIILVSHLGYTTHLKISEAMVTYKEKTGEEEPPSDKDLTRLQLLIQGCRVIGWEIEQKFNLYVNLSLFTLISLLINPERN